MSWDVSIENIPLSYARYEDLPEGYEPPPLCTRKELEEIVFRLFPGILSNEEKTWFNLEGPDYSIEFDSGTEDPVDSVMLLVRGQAGALEPIRRFCDATGWRAVDTSTGDFIDWNNNPDEGFAGWRAFRDRIQPSEYSDAAAIGNGAHVYLVSLNGDNSISSVRKGFDPQALLLGPVFLFRKVGTAMGIVFGLAYFLVAYRLVNRTSDLLDAFVELGLTIGANVVVTMFAFHVKLFGLKLLNRPRVVCRADNEDEAELTGDKILRP